MLVYMHSWRQVEGVSWQASSRWRSSITGRSILSLNGNNWGTWKARTDFKSNNMLYMCLWCCILSNFLDCNCNILTISKYNAPLHINEQWVYHGMLPLHLTWKRFFVQLVPQDRKKGPSWLWALNQYTCLISWYSSKLPVGQCIAQLTHTESMINSWLTYSWTRTSYLSLASVAVLV